ncbi:MAG: PilN domain-containing protein, partial [Patescibacteria group bacterium]
QFLTSSLPQGISLVSLKLVDSKIVLSGITTSESGIATLVSTFSKDSRVKSLSLDAVSKDAKTNLLTFSVSLLLWP